MDTTEPADLPADDWDEDDPMPECVETAADHGQDADLVVDSTGLVIGHVQRN